MQIDNNPITIFLTPFHEYFECKYLILFFLTIQIIFNFKMFIRQMEKIAHVLLRHYTIQLKQVAVIGREKKRLAMYNIQIKFIIKIYKERIIQNKRKN